MLIFQNVKRIFGGLLDAVFPSYCLGCGAELKNGDVVCANCFSRIKIFSALFCAECKNRLPENRKVCHRDAGYLLGAAADYHNSLVAELVRALKFKSARRAAVPLASLLAEYARRASLALEGRAVVPMPLSRRRERNRGFNQSALIGKLFAAEFNLEFSENIVVRDRHSQPQSEINDFEKRRANVKNSFSVRDPKLAQGKNFILIDDVTTSGATFFEAAAALKRAGARKIICLAVAKS